MAMRHRSGAPPPADDASSSTDEEDAFMALSRKNKKAKISEKPKPIDGADSNKRPVEPPAQPLRPPAAAMPVSNTSSMKRHHGALTDKRKARMQEILMDLEEEKHKVNTEPRHQRRSETRGSFVEPGQEHITTNIFVGNMAPTMTEERVGNLFRQFGELYSVKIMWPRTPEEKARNRLTGFICFVHRQDAENAMEACNETDPFNAGRRIMMRWGKNVKQVNNDHDHQMEQPSSTRPALRPERHGQDSIRVQPPRDLRKDAADGRAELTRAELDEFYRLTREQLSVSRDAICRAMVFCFEKSGAAKQIAALLRDLLVESCPNIDTRIARLYLVSDVLYNSQQPGVRNAFLYRDAIERMAPAVFESLGKHGDGRLGRMTMNKLTTAVSAVLAAWTNWSVYNPTFMDELQARFEGREIVERPAKAKPAQQEEPVQIPEQQRVTQLIQVVKRAPQGDWTTVAPGSDDINLDAEAPRASDKSPIGDQQDDIDGAPLEAGEDIDGEPFETKYIDGESLDEDVNGHSLGEDDVDGEPLDEDVDGEPLDEDPDGIPLDDDDLL